MVYFSKFFANIIQSYSYSYANGSHIENSILGRFGVNQSVEQINKKVDPQLMCKSLSALLDA